MSCCCEACGFVCFVLQLYCCTRLWSRLEDFHKVLSYSNNSLHSACLFVSCSATYVECLCSHWCFFFSIPSWLFSVSIQLDANAALSAEYVCHKLDLHSQQLTEHSRGTELHGGEKKHMSRGDWWLASRPLKHREQNPNSLKQLPAALTHEPCAVWIWCKHV